MRIPIRYNRFGRIVLSLLGAPPALSYIEVRGDSVHVQMSWLFRATFPLTHVVSVNPRPATISLGVHGWRGRYLINGALSPLATIRIGADVRAYLMGLPVKLRELLVSVDDPDALRAELARAHAL